MVWHVGRHLSLGALVPFPGQYFFLMYFDQKRKKEKEKKIEFYLVNLFLDYLVKKIDAVPT